MAGGNTVCDVCPAGSFGNTTGSRKRIKGVPARQHFGRSSTQRRYLLSVRGQTSIQWPARLLLQFGSGRQGCCLLTETSMCPAGAVICQPCLPGTFFLYDGAFIAQSGALSHESLASTKLCRMFGLFSAAVDLQVADATCIPACCASQRIPLHPSWRDTLRR